MRVALCFYGQPRYIDNPRSYQSHKNLILSQTDIKFDIFMHYWFDVNILTYDIRGRFQYNDVSPYVIKNTPELLENYYSPIRKLEEKPREFNFNEYNDIKEYCLSYMKERSHVYHEHYFYTTLSQFYSWEKSVNLLLEYSKETKTEYDFVIISRYDNNIISFPDIKNLERNKVYSTGRYRSDAMLLQILISDFNLVDYKPYSNYRNVILNNHENLETDYLQKQAFLLKYNSECITNHPDLDVGLIRSKDDNIGQV